MILAIKKKYVMVFAMSLIVFELFGGFVFAADSLVPCGPVSLGFDQECNTCQLFQLVQNIVTFITVDVAPVLAVAMIVVGAFFLITAGGSETAIKKGKTIITAAIVGILIILGSWLVIDLVLKSLATNNISRSWYKIECSATATTTTTTTTVTSTIPTTTITTPTASTATTSGATYNEITARAEIAKNGVNINNGACSYVGQTGCTDLNGIHKSTIDGVIAIKNQCNCSVTITGGTEAGTVHTYGTYSHQTGYKVDLRFNSSLDSYVYSKINSQSPVLNTNYTGADGNIYRKETDHWDIVIVPK